MRQLSLTFFRLAIVLLFTAATLTVSAQNIYRQLPVGKYAVGFKIITLTDSSRVSSPEYNYIGEKIPGDRLKKITIHLWYPAQDEPGKRRLVYGDYCYNGRQTTTNEVPDTAVKNRLLAQARGGVERWFGATTTANWQRLINTPMLARAEAPQAAGRFPLIVGQLREISTTITNEVLASNGFVVAMVKDENFSSFADAALEEIPDILFAMKYLANNPGIDINQLGCFGFSGSGFIPVLFGIHDYRVKALADIESGIYMDVLYKHFAESNYYKPGNLKVPFLHIFTRDLAKQEINISDFENKTNHSTRYRLIVNQPAMHHWDNAAEGYTACMFLQNRGSVAANTMKCFEIETQYMLNFFGAWLKNDAQAKAFLARKPALPQADSLWSITVLPGVRPAPTTEEFELVIRRQGIKQAMDIVNSTLATDSTTDILTGYMVNGLGYKFLQEKKYAEAIAIFKLNTTLHPDDANFFDSLAEAYEAGGDKQETKQAAAQALQLLARKTNLTDGDRALKQQNEKRVAE